MVEERMLSRRAATRSGSRIPRPVSTFWVDMRAPASRADGEGDDAEEITFHDVLPDPADAGVPLPGSSGCPAGQVRRARPWYVRAVLSAMDGVVQGDAP